MLILWFKLALGFLLKLIVPPPAAQRLPVMDANAPCPACGHRDGEIECVKDLERIVVRHTCHVCRARWNTETVCTSGHILGTNEGAPVAPTSRLPIGTTIGF